MQSMCSDFYCYFAKQIYRVSFSHCFVVEVVTLHNTTEFSHEDVDEIILKQLQEKIVRIAKHVQAILMQVFFSREAAIKCVGSSSAGYL